MVNLASLPLPSLALELVDEHGEPVELPPPPVPLADVPLASLAPGEWITVDFSGFLSAWTPTGRFCGGRPLVTNRRTFSPASADEVG